MTSAGTQTALPSARGNPVNSEPCCACLADATTKGEDGDRRRAVSCPNCLLYRMDHLAWDLFHHTDRSSYLGPGDSNERRIASACIRDHQDVFSHPASVLILDDHVELVGGRVRRRLLL